MYLHPRYKYKIPVRPVGELGSEPGGQGICSSTALYRRLELVIGLHHYQFINVALSNAKTTGTTTKKKLNLNQLPIPVRPNPNQAIASR